MLWGRWLIFAGVLGLVAVPLILWVACPGLPARLESADGFLWVGKEPGSGHPLLLRVQLDGNQVVAGSERYGIPDTEQVACYTGDVGSLLQAARSGGRVEQLELTGGSLQHLRVVTDDLGGGETSYFYRCDSNGARPLGTWSAGPQFGFTALGLGWLIWMAGWIGVGAALARLRRR